MKSREKKRINLGLTNIYAESIKHQLRWKTYDTRLIATPILQV